MYYIQSIASITHQDSFQSSNVHASLTPLDAETEVISPNYKEYVPPAALRRLSPVLRMGLTASIECQKAVEGEFDAISVGTALGCLKDTEKFLTTFITAKSEMLSPTAFIQSTHNTIGGQISLGLKNHAYNMTHTQNNLSFEVALIDALLCVDEGKQNVLVGAADEKIEFLELMQPALISNEFPLSSGASFFVISGKSNSSGIGVRAVHTNFNASDIDADIAAFLERNSTSLADVDLVLYSGKQPASTKVCNSLEYLQYTGMHFSASAFALHIAHDAIQSNDQKRSLIINDMCPGRLGLILVEKS